ncbi:hypothetical protein KAFR_0F02110 [Kazachstania africana CBS 2517]|uniref:Uncharacterized protein n=1 Tax=Kazachstania africana (strain ATCC 22294 / BCRC 22015 / CBS 2517 / CECT 1963 / NBRC 1671 / NRRL Y-8276) TaxID=1071382 RepID=H2AWQ8_KAZAF|nr:hypothetical protein KAFR_0F02110 [Kazachstania africana CBS 2517]CCF58808.1 hypothetical protein KAFR_0F02110 [Kazachstania africana CBS 2517]
MGTLSRLMSSIKGTPIGLGFSNLDLKVEKLKALKRIVDSLWKPTDDMILDPEHCQKEL